MRSIGTIYRYDPTTMAEISDIRINSFLRSLSRGEKHEDSYRLFQNIKALLAAALANAENEVPLCVIKQR